MAMLNCSTALFTKLFLMLLIAGWSCAYPKVPSSAPTDTNGNSSAAQKWLAADKALRQASAVIVKTILPQALQASESLNLTSGCSRDLFKLLMGIKQAKLWAFRMVDSFGKIPNGLLNSGINALGDYDECIETEIPGHSLGQYCTVDIAPPLPPRERFVPYDVMIPEFVNITPPDSVTTQVLKMARSFYRLRIRTSVCVPSTCSRHDVEQIATKVAESMKLEFKVLVTNCETKIDKVIFNTSEIAIIIVLSSLLSVAIFATLVDMCSNEETREKRSLPFKLLLCFSLSRNLRRLLKKDDSPDSIRVFHGMKAIGILWVVLAHTYLFTNYQAMSNLLEARAMTADFVFQVVVNGSIAVQVFFFISAVLSAYGVMKMKQKNINVFMYILRRIWRLAPPFMLVIACVLLIPHLGSGPVWKETIVDRLTDQCWNNWWTNLVFANNFVSLEDMCLRWAWYIPVDTQLYIISLIVLIPLKRNSRTGLIMNFALFLIGIAVSAVFHIYYKLPPAFISVYDHPEDIAYASDFGYHRTYLHCGTYCVGLTVGYILATKPKIRIPLCVNILGWIVAFTLALGVVYGAYGWQQGSPPNSVLSTMYASMSRFLFALACAWVTLSCMNGHGGIVTSFLSWEAFVPLGRLTYMTYLVHPIVIMMYNGSTRNLIRQEHRTLVFLYLANVLMSFMCALPLSLLFESPFLAMERLLISPRRDPNGAVKNETEDNSPAVKEEDPNFNEPNAFAISMKEIKCDT